MNKLHGIIMLGANGSGKSTLGRELACVLNFIHFDVEDYWFYKTDIPYTAIRPQEERKEMLLSDMKKHGSFVVSGDVSGWGNEFLTVFDFVIFITAPTDIRMKRIENREYARWGDRVLEGGVMYESQRKFREFAATRDAGLLEQAASLYLCPILRVDGTKSLSELVHDIKQVLLPSFSDELTAVLSGYTCTKDCTGCSLSKVFRYERNKDVLYLKIIQISNGTRPEKDLFIWLKDKVPVPDVVHYSEKDGYAFLLMTKAAGFMACDSPDDKVHEPIKQTVKLLAEGLLMLQAVDIQECPFINTLDHKLKEALHNIEHDLVDMDDFEEGNDFDSPMELYQWLIENRPQEELCFTHGDYCLPNIFIDDRMVTGFIDIGNGGIADKWQDIALCVRSLGYNLRHTEQQGYIDLLFTYLGIQPNEAKIRYFILLDELF